MSKRVSIAEAQLGHAPEVLKAYGLGSCLAVALYDPELRLGALGHMLLPTGPTRGGEGTETKYVDLGIRRMISALGEAGADPARLVAKTAGGANMFEAEYQTLISGIGSRNARSARQVLNAVGVPLLAEDVGGNRGRTVEFDLASGTVIVYCAHEPPRRI